MTTTKRKGCGCRGKCPQVAHCRTCKEPTFVMVDACACCQKVCKSEKK